MRHYSRQGLRWGVVYKDTLVMACLSRSRAESLVALGNQDTPEQGVILVDLYSNPERTPERKPENPTPNQPAQSRTNPAQTADNRLTTQEQSRDFSKRLKLPSVSLTNVTSGEAGDLRQENGLCGQRPDGTSDGKQQCLAAMPLDSITHWHCIDEGFPGMSPPEFVAMFCKHMKCEAATVVQRIVFKVIRYCAKGGR